VIRVTLFGEILIEKGHFDQLLERLAETVKNVSTSAIDFSTPDDYEYDDEDDNVDEVPLTVEEKLLKEIIELKRNLIERNERILYYRNHLNFTKNLVGACELSQMTEASLVRAFKFATVCTFFPF
jgi:hypothetical protein